MTREEEFSVFWKSYPRRIAKANAKKAFDKAIKRTTIQTMLEGITRYVANKPDYQDYAHPASWLNGERWDDEWEPVQPKAPRYSTPQYQAPSAARNMSREEYLRAEQERAERSWR